MTTKGLDALAKEMQDARARSSTSQYMLRLGDGEAATIRFITDGADIITAFFHSTPGVSTSGKRFFTTVYCDGENEYCELCDDLKESPRRRLLHAYVWVKEKVAADGTVEAINAPRLLQTGPGSKGYITNYLQGFMRKNGTLCDREFEWSRKGKTKDDTSYSLVPEDKSSMPETVAAAAKSLPPLEDVVLGKTAMGGAALEQPKSTPVRRSSLLESLKRRDVDDDDDDALGEEL